MTKQQLADQLTLSLPTVSTILKDLAEKGLVAKGDKLESSGGRPASHITLVFDARVSVGISVSGDSTHFALVDLGPKIVAYEKLDIKMLNSTEFWLEIKDNLNRFIDTHLQDRTKLLGIGIAVHLPVVADDSAGFSPFAEFTSLPATHRLSTDWDFNIIRSIFGEHTVINNVSKMAGYAQAWGAGERGDFVYLTFGRGVGGAIIADRNVIGGLSKNAEFGHMVLNDDGPLCSCGQRGCFGRYCSSMSIVDASGLSVPEFFSRLSAGDAHCREEWEVYMHYLSIGINNIRLVFDGEIVIGGELSVYIRDYEDDLKARLAARNPFGDDGNYVRIGSFGEYDAAFGAALVHIDRFLS